MKCECDRVGNKKLFCNVLKNIQREILSKCKHIKSMQGKIIGGEEGKMEKWKEYFEEILNTEQK